MAYGAMREQMEQNYGANYEQEMQRRATLGVNPGVVNTAIHNIAEIAEEFTVTDMKIVQNSVIDVLKDGWLTVSGKERIEFITSEMNNLANDVVKAVNSMTSSFKDSAERIAWEGLQERISISLKSPTVQAVNCDGVKDNDNGSYYIISEFLENAKGSLLNTIVPDVARVCEKMKKAASKSGLFDKDGSLQGQVDAALSSLEKQITERVTEMVKKIDESLTYQSDEANKARAAGAVKLTEMQGIYW